MLRRNLAGQFAAGAYVFPGGRSTPRTGDPAARSPLPRPDRCRGQASLGLGSGGLAFWVAALRECFEEAGVMLAYPGGPTRCRAREGTRRGRAARHVGPGERPGSPPTGTR